MKDVYEVLRVKEIDVSRLQMEVDALRIVAPLPGRGWGIWEWRCAGLDARDSVATARTNRGSVVAVSRQSGTIVYNFPVFPHKSEPVTQDHYPTSS